MAITRKEQRELRKAGKLEEVQKAQAERKELVSRIVTPETKEATTEAQKIELATTGTFARPRAGEPIAEIVEETKTPVEEAVEEVEKKVEPHKTAKEREAEVSRKLYGTEEFAVGEGEESKEKLFELEKEGIAETEKRIEFQKQQQATAQKLAEAEQARTVERGERGISAVEEAFTTGREAAISTAREQIAPIMGEATRKLIGEAQTRLDAANAARAETIRRMEVAKRQDDFARVKSLTARLDTIDKEAAEAETALLKEQAAGETRAQGMIAQDTKMVGTIYDDQTLLLSSADQISNKLAQFPNSAIGLQELLAKKSGLQDLQEAIKSKDPEKIANAKAALGQLETEAQTSAMAAVKQSQQLQAAVASGEITQAQADFIAAKLGFGAKPKTALEQQIELWEGKVKTAKSALEVAEAQKQLNRLNQLNSTDMAIAMNKIALFSKGDRLERPEGHPNKIYEGECGAFVNDIIGKPLRYGSSLGEKTRNINKTDVFNPAAGDIFVSTQGNTEIGHVGFVESVDPIKGTVTLVDSNRYGKRKVNRREVPIRDLASQEKIVGYESPIAESRETFTLSPEKQLETELKLKKDFDAAAKEPQKALRQFNIMKASLKRAEDILSDEDVESKDINAASQGILVTFQKILDPTSVVRESEYARSGEGQSLIEKGEGWIDKIVKGGAGVTIDSLREFVATAEAFTRGYEDSVISAAERELEQINRFGLNQKAILPKEVIDLVEERSREESDQIKEDMITFQEGATVTTETVFSTDEESSIDSIYQ